MKKVKQFLAMATLGIGALVSQSAFAQDVNADPGVTAQLQSIQQKVDQETKNFTNVELNASGELKNIGGDEPVENPSIDDGSLKSIGGDDIVLPDEVIQANNGELKNIGGDEPVENPSIDDGSLKSIGADEPNPSLDVGGGEAPVKQAEVCDRKANEPSTWKYFTGIGMKGLAIIATLTSSGTLAPATYSVSKAADYLMKNGCDNVDLRKEILDVTSTVVTAGAGPWVSMATDFALDKAVDKYDQIQEEKIQIAKAEAEKKSQMAKAEAEPVIEEVAVVQTSEKIDIEAPLTKIDGYSERGVTVETDEAPLTKIDGYSERGVTPETDEKPLTKIDGYAELGEKSPKISLKFDKSAVDANRVSAQVEPEPVKSKMRVLK